MQDTTQIIRRSAKPMQTVYVKGRSFRLEYTDQLFHPMQLKADWARVMESDDMANGTIRIARPKARVYQNDETRIMARV